MRYLTIEDLREKGCKFFPVYRSNFVLGDITYIADERDFFETADQIYEFLKDKNAAILCDNKDRAVRLLPNSTYMMRWCHINPRYIEGPILYRSSDPMSGDMKVYVGDKEIISAVDVDVQDIIQDKGIADKIDEFRDWYYSLPTDSLLSDEETAEPEPKEPEKPDSPSFGETPPREIEID